MSSALMENSNVIDAVTSRSRAARANAFYLFFKISLRAPGYSASLLRAPRKITVGQKSATVGTCSAHESHVLVRVRNWIFRGALKDIAQLKTNSPEGGSH